MADPAKSTPQTEPDSTEEYVSRHPRLDNLFGLKGQPWTEGDSKFFEALTGEKDTWPTVPDDPDDLL
jgi:hypothetical protein